MITPTGFHTRRDEGDAVVFTRTFKAPVDDVWAAVTESERTARWIGSYTGDPADGYVMFTMNAEEGDPPATRYDIERCTPPQLLHIRATDDFGTWILIVELSTTADGTLLTLSQIVTDPTAIGDTGPGWEYYLDRLTAAEAGRDADEVQWDDYYPALRDHYLAIQHELGG